VIPVHLLDELGGDVGPRLRKARPVQPLLREGRESEEETKETDTLKAIEVKEKTVRLKPSETSKEEHNPTVLEYNFDLNGRL
jgi:hypothetical protein